MVSGCKRSWEGRSPSLACLTHLVAGPQTQFQRVACVLSHFSRVRLFVTPWTVTCQALQSMGFSKQKYWSGLPFPSPGDLPNPGIEPQSPVLQTDSLPPEPPGKPRPKNKWWRRHTKSPCLTAHVHASLEGRPEAPEALFHLSEGGEGAALAGGAQGQVGVGRGSANSRNPLPRKGGQGPATSSS